MLTGRGPQLARLQRGQALGQPLRVGVSVKLDGRGFFQSPFQPAAVLVGHGELQRRDEAKRREEPKKNDGELASHGAKRAWGGKRVNGQDVRSAACWYI